MCDVTSTTFFRPWKSDVAGGTISETSKMVKSETEASEVKKCLQHRRDSDEENETDADSLWSASSDIGGYQRRSDLRRQLVREHSSKRRFSLGSSCSTASDDPSATGSPYNFAGSEIGGTSGEENGHAVAENSSPTDVFRDGSSHSSSEAFPSVSGNSAGSAFAPIPHGAHPTVGYPAPLRMDPIAPGWLPSHLGHVDFLQGLGSLPIPDYGNCMEAAVQYIHRQDVAAKQMKKLRPKKFRCDHCGVAFSNNGQLKGHIRIHTGERPFKCEIEGCNKAFTRNEELTRHRKIHTGLKPHSCDVCGKSFGRKDHLKKHQRTHQNRGIPAHFGAAMFGFMEHFGHYQTLPPGHPLPPYHCPASV